MATRPKLTEQNVAAEGRHVAAATRRNMDAFQEVDARREKKLLTEEFLTRFELRIEGLDAATGGGVTGSAIKTKATTAEAAFREELYRELAGFRAEIRITYEKDDPGICRAYGTGLDLTPRSTPVLLKVGQAVLSSWKEQELRAAAEAAGIEEARVSRIGQLVESLSQADTAQNEALTKGRGRTLTKAQLVRAVRADTTYVRGVAAVVFRDNPAVLTEFESTLPRQTVQPRGTRGKGTKGSLALDVPRKRRAKAEKAAEGEEPAKG